jgi:hypothetical protein
MPFVAQPPSKTSVAVEKPRLGDALSAPNNTQTTTKQRPNNDQTTTKMLNLMAYADYRFTIKNIYFN